MPGQRSSETPRPAHRADVQGLRAVAVLLVVAFHAALPVRGGFMGVDVFFVVSGFVITGLLARELQSSGRLDLGGFVARRVRRLLPALALVVTVTLVASAMLQPEALTERTARTAVAAALFAANLEAYRSSAEAVTAPTGTDPLAHLWSLGVEEQFYLVLPAVLLLLWRLRRRRSALVAGIAVVSVGSFLVSYVTSVRGLTPFGIDEPRSFAVFLLPARAWELGVGALLALALPRVARPVAVTCGLVGAVLLALTAFALPPGAPFPGVVVGVPVLGTALLLVAGTGGGRGGVPALLSARPLVWLGDRSYAWYLWHWPAIVLTREVLPDSRPALVVAATLSLAPAWASYRWIEQPLRRDRQIVGRRAVALAGVCVAVPVAAAFAVASA